MIDRETQSLLKDQFNPEGSPLRKHQLALLKILKYVDFICRENGITYWLSSGSCLGAIRHGGFIPWDDDIDIEMMRDDYLRFERVFKATDKYVLQTYKNDPFYFTVFAKVRDRNTKIYDSLYKYKGVFIDVFVLENTNRSLAYLAEKIRKPISWNFYHFIKKNRENKFVFYTCAPVFLALKYIYFIVLPVFRLFTKILPNNELRHVYGTGWVDNIRKANEIIEPIRVPFEDALFPVPADYDSYLSRIFGADYMTVPSKDKIGIPHIEFFDV